MLCGFDLKFIEINPTGLARRKEYKNILKEYLIVTFAKAAGAVEAYHSSPPLGGKRPCRRRQVFNCHPSVLFSSLLGFGSEHKSFSILLNDFGQRFTGSRGGVPPRPKVRAPENITTTRHTHSSLGNRVFLP